MSFESEPNKNVTAVKSTELNLKTIGRLRREYDSRREELGHRGSRHEQVSFLGFDVDKKLLGVIEGLWILGMPTHSSCEGHPELCHRDLVLNERYYARVIFELVADAARFFSMVSEALGVGETYTDEPFQLKAVLPAYLEEGDPDTEELYEYIERSNAATRGEVFFHPEYIVEIEELLRKLIAEPPYVEKLKALSSAETTDETYSALGISDDVRLEAERGQKFIIDDPTRDPDELRYSRQADKIGW